VAVILVVDQDPEILEQASRILNRDRQVFLASNGEKAFEMGDDWLLGRIGGSGTSRRRLAVEPGA
jgi:hypothetical protein